MQLSPTIAWFIAGFLLCAMELILPTAFVEFAMGISAILVAFVSFFLPSLSIQVILWLIISVVLIALTRRFVSKSSAAVLEDAKEAQTMTEIPAGQTGRVLYEGNSWQARCGDEELAIAPQQKVYVIGRKGTTLIVMPEHLLKHVD
jgi:membrane protein implicated in regulation of membrane protease activity